MARTELNQMINDICKDLSYDDVKIIKDEINNILFNKLEWKPLKFYNPYKNETIDFSSTHLVAYDKESYNYKIKQIKTNKLITEKNGQYGTYWTIKKVNIGEWQLKKCLNYPDEKTFNDAVLTEIKNQCGKCIEYYYSSLELDYLTGKTKTEIIDKITNVITYDLINETNNRAFEKIKTLLVERGAYKNMSELLKTQFIKDHLSIYHVSDIVKPLLYSLFKTEIENTDKRCDRIRLSLLEFIVLSLKDRKDIADSLNLSIDEYNKKINTYDFNQLTDEEIEQLIIGKKEVPVVEFGGYRHHYIVLSMAIKIFGTNESMIRLIDHYPYRDVEWGYKNLIEKIYE